MKITVLAQGSRGDVQPPLSLAYQLAVRGHDVTIAVPANYAAAAAKIGCRAVTLPLDGQALVMQDQLLGALKAGRTFEFFRAAFDLERTWRLPVADAVAEACDGSALIVVPTLLEDLTVSLAAKHRQRIAFALPMPVWRNSGYAHMLISTRRLPAWLTRLTYTLAELGARKLLPGINEVRARMGLHAVRRRPALDFQRARPPVFYWAPEAVLPRPLDLGANHHYTGYWAVPPMVRAALGESLPPPSLESFLAGGTPPLFAGFGSMPVVDARVLEIIERASAGVGLRVVLGQGWSHAEAPASDRLRIVEGVDHDWLLPRCAVALHHGGASTTGAALRAGVPSVIASVFADQPFWGRRVAELGAGTTFRFQHMTSDRLRGALEQALSPATQARARSLAAEIAAAPDGAEVAAQLITDKSGTYPIPQI